MIVDDICDGGRTFIELLNKITENRVSECAPECKGGVLSPLNVILYTTFGLYSKGREVLLDSGINKIFSYFEKDSNWRTY